MGLRIQGQEKLRRKKIKLLIVSFDIKEIKGQIKL
jgi:hypothetical protein